MSDNSMLNYENEKKNQHFFKKNLKQGPKLNWMNL